MRIPFVILSVWFAVSFAVFSSVPAVRSQTVAVPSQTVASRATTQQVIDEVAKLVASLGDADAAVREAGEKSMIALGTRALNSVRAQLSDATDPEVIDRLERVIGMLERDQILEPQRVTISLKNPTAFELGVAIGEAFGLDHQQQLPPAMMAKMPQFNKRLGDIQFDEVNWFEAIDRLRQLTDVGVPVSIVEQSKAAFSVQPEGDRQANMFIVESGPVRIFAMNWGYIWRKTILRPEVGVSKTDADLNLTLGVECEPRLMGNGERQFFVKINQAVDSKGQSVIVTGGQRGLNLGQFSSHPYRLSVPMLVLDDPAPTLKLLQGSIEFLHPIGKESATFAGVSPGGPAQKHAVGSAQVEMIDCKPLVAQGASTAVVVRLVIDDPESQNRMKLVDPQWAVVMNQAFRYEVTDAAGKPLYTKMMGSQGDGTRTRTMLSFNLIDPAAQLSNKDNARIEFPIKVVISRPKSYVPVSIPFELHDLPMGTPRR